MIDDLLTYAVIDNECYRIGYQEALDKVLNCLRKRLQLYLEREQKSSEKITSEEAFKEILSYTETLEALNEYSRKGGIKVC